MRVAFDIGGTFTDVVIEHERRLYTAKLLSLLDQVGEDIVRETGRVRSGQVDRYIHATTICSNALVQGRVARTALLTTRGFRDVLEMRNQKGPRRGGLGWEPPKPIVARNLRYEIDERIAADGSVLTPLDEAQARETISDLVAKGVEAIAVSLLNSYENDSHERQLAALVREMAPQLVLCLSCDVHPEIREYERVSTTVINTGLIPVARTYLDKLEGQLGATSNDLLIMQSNGGLMSAKAARRRPMHIVESGPAAGVLAVARLARDLGLDKVISFDMGGTTAKACLIRDGAPLERAGGEVGSSEGITESGEGHSLRAPMIDLVEVGAGGGSIGWLDDKVLRVGPQSAGADPGPVCYGRGGSEPTVTDANLVLGRLGENIAGGTLQLDLAAAQQAMDRLSQSLGLDRLSAAEGIVRVANAVMGRAIRAVSVERGYDPRDFILMPFGGAGSLHATALAEQMGITQILVPPAMGLFSALGLLLADYRFDYLRTIALPIERMTAAEIAARFDALEAQAREEMAELGVPVEELALERRADMRYSHQVEDLIIDISDEEGAMEPSRLDEAFEQAHRRQYGYPGDGRKVLTSLRLRLIAPAYGPDFADLDFATADTATGPTIRPVYFGPEYGMRDTPVVRRSAVTGRREGPIVIEENDSTILVAPGWTVTPGQWGTLLLTR